MVQANTPLFTSSVWDRMIAPAGAGAARPGATGNAIAPAPARATAHTAADTADLTLDQFKRAIARDLEALLNTRIALPDGALAGLPYCTDSIVNFGLADFAQLCLSDSEDRKEICDRLRAAIARHEPRLRNVRTRLVPEAGAINRLSFVISGQLRDLAAGDRVRFDLMLEPSSLHYSIR